MNINVKSNFYQARIQAKVKHSIGLIANFNVGDDDEHVDYDDVAMEAA